MKTEFIDTSNPSEFEKELKQIMNRIPREKLVDVKFQTTSNGGRVIYSAVIIYTL